MGSHASEANRLDLRIAARLKALRAERGWSLETLARESGVSRATLSRLEKADVSATAVVLARLCSAYGLTMSRLLHQVEDHAEALIPRSTQPVWDDPGTGFERRSVSPPADGLSGEVLECTLQPGTRIEYDAPNRPVREHHLVMLGGALTIVSDGQSYALTTGDCLRFRPHATSGFTVNGPDPAHYLLFLV